MLPMLLVLLLGVADFGRVFTAGITAEAAARNGAEIAAQEYLRYPPGSVNYAALHQLAIDGVCEEMRLLPNTDYDPGTGTCGSMPVVGVCVYDDAMADPNCGATSAAPPPGCDTLAPGSWAPAKIASSETSDYVEVRVCYRFTTLFNLTDLQLPLGAGLNLGTVHLEKQSVFTIFAVPES